MNKESRDVTREYRLAKKAAEHFNPGEQPDIAKLMLSAYTHGYAEALLSNEPRELPESLQDPIKTLERGRAINKAGLNSWRDMDPYERAVRIAEEWQKTDEARKFLVDIIKLAEQLGEFDHDTKWRSVDSAGAAS